jgi:phage I-like protein
MARLRAKQRDALSASSFAYVDSDGGKHLPIHDEAHARAAMGRFSQTEFESSTAKAKARRKIVAAAKKFGIEVGDDAMKMGEPWMVAAPPSAQTLSFGEGAELVVARVGEWEFGPDSGIAPDAGGRFAITPEDAAAMVRNFEQGARRQDIAVLVNEEHIPAEYDLAGEALVGPGAVGWIQELRLDGDKLVAVPQWNAAGERLRAEDRYRAVSPEIIPDWQDPETGEAWGMTLAGLALTNFPRMKGLAGQPLTASERGPRARVLAFADEPAAGATKDGGDSVEYAWPDEQRGPLNSKAGVKGAISRFLNVKGKDGKAPMAKDRDAAWTRIRKAAKEHGVFAPPSWRKLTAAEVRAYAMAADNTNAPRDEDGDSVMPCIHQPPFRSLGTCLGYTSPGVDDTGDVDACIHAAAGCNGYLPVSETQYTRATSDTGYYYAEDAMGKTKDMTTGTGTGQQPPAPPAPEPAAPAPSSNGQPLAHVRELAELTDAQLNEAVAKMGEPGHLVRLAVQAQRATMAENQALRGQLAASERGHKLAAINERLERCRDSGRITPAEFETLTKDGGAARFSEDDAMLALLEARAPIIAMGERGADGGAGATAIEDDAKLDRDARAFMAEHNSKLGQGEKKLGYREAVLEVSRRTSRVGYQG